MATCHSCHEECPENRYIPENDEYYCWDCEREDNQKEYKDYLRSDRWQSTRRRKLVEADFKCERCGRVAGLEVHHKTYARRGKERMEDLEVLCTWCHREEHGRL